MEVIKIATTYIAVESDGKHPIMLKLLEPNKMDPHLFNLPRDKQNLLALYGLEPYDLKPIEWQHGATVIVCIRRVSDNGTGPTKMLLASASVEAWRAEIVDFDTPARLSRLDFAPAWSRFTYGNGG